MPRSQQLGPLSCARFVSMEGFLPFLRIDLSRPLLPLLLAQDAAGGGDGAGPPGLSF